MKVQDLADMTLSIAQYEALQSCELILNQFPRFNHITKQMKAERREIGDAVDDMLEINVTTSKNEF